PGKRGTADRSGPRRPLSAPRRQCTRTDPPEGDRSISVAHDISDFIDLDDVVFGRRTVRRFLPDPVPEATILGMIEAATRAPSAHNRQPWRFHVVRDAEGKV